MYWIPIPLEIPEKKVLLLKNLYADIVRHIQEGRSLKSNVLDCLVKEMSSVIQDNKSIITLLENKEKSGVVISLQHSDNDILNLPWISASDSSGKLIGDFESICLTKSIPGYYVPQLLFQKVPPPLKILVIISSPEDLFFKNRLSYEEEERLMLESFAPLIQNGQVQIDFCNDASMDTLKSKLQLNKYHVLHFSGHSAFDEKRKSGFLTMENSITMSKEEVSDEEFANGLNINQDHLVPLVILSSCQSAQGSANMTGITNKLFNIGIPAVISMGLSINDYYATLFTTRFYQQLINHSTVPSAFMDAVKFLRKSEFEEIKNNSSNPIPLQWIIPNLYISKPIESLVDWESPNARLEFPYDRFFKQKILIDHPNDYLFIGRKADKKLILPSFREKRPILLKGQGGVGKTALAEHLVQRLFLIEPNLQPFFFNESTFRVKNIIDQLIDFLLKKGNTDYIAAEKLDGASKKIIFLLGVIKRNYCNPLLIFDNLESFQCGPGEKFKEEYLDIENILKTLVVRNDLFLLLTCRYPVFGDAFKSLLTVDLNHNSFNDFWKRCNYLELSRLYDNYYQSVKREGTQTVKIISFPDLVKQLYESFGGNFRALQFFNDIVINNPQKFTSTLNTLTNFKQKNLMASEEVLQKMSKNLLFDELISLIDREHLFIFLLLSGFRIPVSIDAIIKQLGNKDTVSCPEKALEVLQRYTLIERHKSNGWGDFFYVTPLIRELLLEKNEFRDLVSFSHNEAGYYYLNVFNSLDRKNNIQEMEEAFFHFIKADNKKEIGDAGAKLSEFFFSNRLYIDALQYANQSFGKLQDDTPVETINLLGMLYQFFGELSKALSFYEKSLIGYRNGMNKAGEAETISNMAMIYHTEGKLDEALIFLEQSLQIWRELKSKLHEGRTLNNISQIYDTRCDYYKALDLLKQSYRISEEAGDKETQGKTLNNIGEIFRKQIKYHDALELFEQSLEIRKEIGDKAGESTVLNNISQIYQAQNKNDKALDLFLLSLKIDREIGDRPGEAVTLNNIGHLYRCLEMLDEAQDYFEQSLIISREVNDIRTEAIILNNIASIVYAKGNYSEALEPFEKSLKLTIEFGDKALEGTILMFISLVYQAQGDYLKALDFSNQSLKIRREISNLDREA
jgi:tetratricopeptide (TPR) repeat protein